MEKNNFDNRLGFTLIELMVVISIIGLLTTMIMVNIYQAKKQGRDAKRRGDMKSVQNAFEQYRVVNGVYPKIENEAKVNFQDLKVPLDPLNRTMQSLDYTYKYTYDTTNGLSYCACALLENSGKGNATDNICTSGTGNYLCVKNLQ